MEGGGRERNKKAPGVLPNSGCRCFRMPLTQNGSESNAIADDLEAAVVDPGEDAIGPVESVDDELQISARRCCRGIHEQAECCRPSSRDHVEICDPDRDPQPRKEIECRLLIGDDLIRGSGFVPDEGDPRTGDTRLCSRLRGEHLESHHAAMLECDRPGACCRCEAQHF